MGETALLWDAWRLIKSMIRHNCTERPTADHVCRLIESDGLNDPTRRRQMWKHVNRLFNTRGSFNRFAPSNLNRSPRIPWRHSDDWTRFVRIEADCEALRGWFVDSQGQAKRYDLDRPEDILRLARNIPEHFHECFGTMGQEAKALFAAPAEYTNGGVVDNAKYAQAVADWFCCTFPDLVGLLWDGLPACPALAF